MEKTLKQLTNEYGTEKDLEMAEKLHEALTKPMEEIETKIIDLFPGDETEIRIKIKTKTFKTIKIEITDITREEKFI